MNKHMKKIALLLALMVSMSTLAACSGDDAVSSTPESSVESSIESSVESSEESSEESSAGEPSEEESSTPVEDASSVVAPDAGMSEEPGAETSSDLETLVDSLYDGIPEDELPAIMKTPLTEENAEYMAGVPAGDFAEGIAADAAINAIAHSVVLLRANSADDAPALAEKVEANANPNKWICVGAEKVIVKTSGEYVLLIMSSATLADQIAANFDAAFPA